jgi:hypothetical protein
MTGQPGRSGGPRENSGGKREGAGRPPGITGPGTGRPKGGNRRHAARQPRRRDVKLGLSRKTIILISS